MKRIIPVFLSVVLILGGAFSVLAANGSFMYSQLYVKDQNSNYQLSDSNVISLKKYPTSITIKRTDAEGEINVAGAEISVLDSNNDAVTTFTTGNEPKSLTGILTGGQTYTVKEVSSVEGHTPEVSEKEITIENTADEQVFIIKDLIDDESETEDPAPDADFKISSKTLALTSGISLFFNVKGELFADKYTAPKIVVNLEGIETEITDYTIDSNGRYVFEFTNITPDRMNVMLTATLYAYRNGKEYASPEIEYSVATYCYNMLNKYGETPGYETLRTLLVDMLNYGAASQNYTKINIDNLANKDLTATQKSWESGELGTLRDMKNNTYKTISNPSVKWIASGLALQDAVIVRMKFQAASTEGLVVRVSDDDGATWDIEAEDFDSNGNNQYYIYFKKFNVGRMGDCMYFTVYDGDTAVSNTYRYSIESYVYIHRQDGNALGELVTAMMKYGNSAKAYS